MNKANKIRLLRKFKTWGVIIFILLPFFLLGCLFSKKAFCEKVPVDNVKIALGYCQIPLDHDAKGPVHSVSLPTFSRAPEPSALILFLSGVIGIIVNFVRKSFKKFKRFLDIMLSTLGLLLISPFILLAGLLIKLTSKGPIIYKQKRVGEGGRLFEIYKLRSMRVDAEAGTGAVWARSNDPRTTSIGRILRKTHIDEIPQLINVLKGEMSIVGPRPERPEMVRDFKNMIIDYERRLMVKPGITGLAQVWHKYDENLKDVKKKIKYDLLYIKKMCLIADLRIMAQTMVVVLIGKGAN